MIMHIQLTKIAFTEAVKKTSPYLKEKAGGIRNIMTSLNSINKMYDYYGQAHRHEMGIEYLKQNPNCYSRDVKIIEEILLT